MKDYHIPSNKIIIYVFIPVLLALIVSATVNLQLFQDGGSYLFEMLDTKSTAIRHHRFSVFLIQFPTVFLIKLLIKSFGSVNTQLPAIRLIFSLSYALIPIISLCLSWLVVRKRNEGLFLWAALIILFINLVNFSWVSELLISLQLSCPLMLASVLMPGTRLFGILMIILLPIMILLHPLVVPLFLTMAIGSAYVGYKKLKIRWAAWQSAAVFLIAAIIKTILNLFILTSYETSFLESKGMSEYLVETSLENKLFLLISLLIGAICLIGKLTLKSKLARLMILVVLGFIQSISITLIFVNLNIATNPLEQLLTFLIVSIGVGLIFKFNSLHLGSSVSYNIKIFYKTCFFSAVIAGGLLVSQYLYIAREFPLKTGLALFVALSTILMMSADSVRKISHTEYIQRFKLITVLAIVFSFVIVSKSLMWQSSIDKLKQSLLTNNSPCIELVSQDFKWLQKNPYNIINTWALPSLALILQDTSPRKLLLEKNSCQVYHESGQVQIDEWTTIPKFSIFPTLD